MGEPVVIPPTEGVEPAPARPPVKEKDETPTRMSDCSCKGIWLTTSPCSGLQDRYRLNVYQWQARLDSSGNKVALADLDCDTYCPVTSGCLYVPGWGISWYQQLNETGGGDSTNHWRLAGLSWSQTNSGPIVSGPYKWGQAFRAGYKTAVAVSTCTGVGVCPTPPGLRLSIADAFWYGCP